jgi:hypothetical protein
MAILDDQCVTATNVEFARSMLGERRRGTSAVTLPASLSGKDRITFLYRHVPGTDETAAELYALGVTSTTTVVLSQKTTAWADITISDTPLLTGFTQYQWNAVSLHGKVFFAFDSDQDRLHVLDSGSTTMRRVGIAAPVAPTSADTGVGTFVGTRYYRVRMTVQSGGVTLRRSEAGAVWTDAPSGTGTGIVVTKPATVESATHWELEASIDNVNFYIVATTVVGTTTVTDSVDYQLGYAASSYTLSEDSGDYTVIGSAKYLTVDEDRLVWGGSWETASLSSTVGWTPVNNADGVGNDERQELDTDPTLDLDGQDGGVLTGLTSATSGELWAFKLQRIYKLVRTGLRSHAYEAICMTKARGALHGSVVSGVDEQGRPCVFALDLAVGPIRVGSNGILQCGADIRTTWDGLSLAAAKVVCSGLFYPATRQVIWNIATSSADVPNLSIVLQTNEMRLTDDGIRRGWSTWTGTRSTALAMCLFSSNIEAGTARNRILVPFIGIEGSSLLHLCDTGADDNGTAYAAQIRTKPYTLRSLLHRFGIRAAALLGKAVTGARVAVSLILDFGLDTPVTVSQVTFDAAGSETQVFKALDQFVGSEMTVAQFDFSDTTTAGTRFELNHLTLIGSVEQSH